MFVYGRGGAGKRMEVKPEGKVKTEAEKVREKRERQEARREGRKKVDAFWG